MFSSESADLRPSAIPLSPAFLLPLAGHHEWMSAWDRCGLVPVSEASARP
jgi:hypothetical protein